MSQSPTFDVSLERLRRIGGVKWSQYPDKIGAFVAEMDFGTAAPIADAMHDAIDLGLLGYLPEHLATRLAEAWCGFARDRYGWEVPPERVRPLADVMAGFQSAVEHFSTPGSAVILPTPAYMPFLFVPATLGRKVIQVPMATDEDGRSVYDLAALDAAFAAGGNLLVLCNPHNPVGRVLERSELEAVAEVVERNGGRVFSDEIHAPLGYDGHRHVPYASVSSVSARHTVTAVSASKAWNLPGVKCAQLVLSNDTDAAVWDEVGRIPEHGASNLGVVANIAAYEQGGPWLAQVLEYLDGSRRLLGQLLADRIPEIGYVQPEGTYLAWLDCRALGLGDHPAEFFLERAGVALTDGPLCGEASQGFVRYAFATPRAIMEQTVERMAEALRNR
ncbi:MAG: cysteine-S-conjugate beta-lyase [Nocardioidaceae bacterium]|jgi:cystathionine beta-lyase|nr:cysteine-S-conjugate beta-lyase [Nocardioidaceae bacterium]